MPTVYIQLKRSVVCLIVVAAISLSPTPAPGAERLIQFEQPRHLSTVTGSTGFSIALNLPKGVRAESVDVSVDGALVVTLTKSPWKGTWDAGDGSNGHELVAIVHLSNGSTHKAVVRTTPIRIQEVEDVDLVNLFTVVKDKGGDYVQDLTREQFTLLEDGVPQRISIFSTDSKPLAIAVVLDTSLSMEGAKLDAARKSALRFVSTLSEGDRGMIMTFNNRVQVLQPPTLDRNELIQAVESIEIQKRGGTALYDGIWRAADYLRRLEGRRVLVLLTDGRDETSSGLEPGSLHTLVEASNHTNRNDVMVFAVGYGRTLDDLDIYQRQTLRNILERLAETSGGAVLFPRRIGSLKSAFEAVTRDLRHQYNIAYTSSNKERDGEWRVLELRTDTKGHEVVTRKGYFAPGGHLDDSDP